MKRIPLFLITAAAIAACNVKDPEWESDEVEGVAVTDDAVVLEPVEVDTSSADSAIVYENDRFRNVQVETLADRTFRITGEAQVFEGSFSWTVEDGHNVLKEGHEQTSAGAPQWGTFDFTVQAEKDRENSTLHLVLYEGSPKDGSRQHELPVLLY